MAPVMFWSAPAQIAANSSLFIEQIPIVDEASIKSEIPTYCKLGAREESCTKRKSSGRPWLFVRFGSLANKPLRAKTCRCPLAAVRSGGTVRLRPRSDLDVYLFRNGKGIVNLNAEISDGALNLGVAKQ